MGDGSRRITVRYFAAARAAAGTEAETVTISQDATLGALVEALRSRNGELATILARCSYLRDGVAVRDLASTLSSTETVDVLPPFAGG